jgi:DNA-binding GntR family transcriptional regulator
MDNGNPGAVARTHRYLLRDQVLDAVRAAILEGRVSAGEWLNEEVFCRQLGVSRSPLREALRQLEREGLVRAVPHRGSMVTRLTARDAAELYGVRAALESYAAELLAASADQATLVGLQAVVRGMREAIAREDTQAAVECDLQFHSRLCEASGNELLIRIHHDLIDRIRMLYHLAGLPVVEEDDFLHSHLKIVNAIASGHPEEAVRVVRDHTEHAARRLATRLDAQSDDAGRQASRKRERTRRAS